MVREIKGLVLRSVKYAESDKLLTVLTAEGKKFFKARGIRNLTSKNAAGCAPFVYSEFLLDERGDKCYLRKARPLYSTLKTGADIQTIALASYFAQLAEDTARDAETGEMVLRLLMNALFLLSKEDRPQELVKGVFEMRLLAANGLMPLLDACAHCEREVSRLSGMFFRLTQGDVVCRDCLNSFDTHLIRVSREVLEVCRHSIEETEEKAYAIRLSPELLKEFSHFSQSFLLAQMERGYDTLDFYTHVKHLGKT